MMARSGIFSKGIAFSSSDEFSTAKARLIAVQSLTMSGRFRLSRTDKQIAEHFDTPDEVEWLPRYNIAPAQRVAVVRQSPERPVRHFSLVRWGLIPEHNARCNAHSPCG